MNILDSIISAGNVELNWDSYGANPPSKLAVENALKFGKILVDNLVEPDMVGPTRDESIMIIYSRGKWQYGWDFYSDGGIGCMIIRNGKSECFNVEDINDFWEKLENDQV